MVSKNIVHFEFILIRQPPTVFITIIGPITQAMIRITMDLVIRLIVFRLTLITKTIYRWFLLV